MPTMVRKVYSGDDTWVAPAGVVSVRALTVPMSTISQIAMGNPNAFAIDINKDLYAWGRGAFGANGDGTITDRCQPVLVLCSFKWTSISGHNSTALGVTTSGDGYGWGSSDVFGMVGDGTQTRRCAPTPICCNLKWRSLLSGSSHSLGITSIGDIYSWGSNQSGQLGDGTTTAKCQPGTISLGCKWKSVFAGGSTTFGITVNGDSFSWGSNNCGALGNGSTTNKCVPTLICCGIKFKTLSQSVSGAATLGLATNGTGYAWGGNAAGAIGDGTITARCLPTPISGGLKFKQLLSGVCVSYGVTTQGDAYAWGSGGFGGLGDGTTTAKCVPTLVLCGFKWRVLAAGETNSVIGITVDGDIYGWGLNSCGQLGDNTNTNRCVPTLLCCSKIWGYVAQAQQRRSYDVVPGTSYPVKNFTRFAEFNGDPIDEMAEAIVLEYYLYSKC